MTHALRLLLGALAALLAAAAPAAAADEWRPVGTSCLNALGGSGCAQGFPMSGLPATAASPDGRSAYVVSSGAKSVAAYGRDPATGALSRRAGLTCVNEDGTGECLDGRGLEAPSGVVLSPDGRFAYVGGLQGGVAVLERDPATGALRQRAATNACLTGTGQSDGTGSQCVDGHGLGDPMLAFQMSPDGRNLYLGAGPIAVLRRDAASGTVFQDAGTAGCVASVAVDGCAPVRGLGSGALQSAISPDGRHFYAPSGSGIAVFDRDEFLGGELIQKPGQAGCLNASGTSGCAREPRVAGVTSVVASADGRTVYAAGGGAGIVTLDRAGDGTLRARDCLNERGSGGCGAGADLVNLAFLALSPDGRDLVATHAEARDALVILRRDPVTGALAQPAGPDGCLSRDGSGVDDGRPIPGGCREHPGMGATATATFAGDGMFYAGATASSTVVTVKRDFYPTCSGAGADVAADTPATVSLACSDRNGDPLGFSIVDPPGSGLLGPVDAAGASVTYTPSSGFSGADAFTFKATSAGLESAPARAALAVAPRAPAPPSAAGPRRVDSPVSSRWGVRGKRLFLLALAVKAPPRRAVAELRCRGERCPFGRRRVKKPRKGALTVFKNLRTAAATRVKARRFRAGQRLELRITAPGRIGKAVRFELKKGKIPSGRQGCLPIERPRFRARC